MCGFFRIRILKKNIVPSKVHHHVCNTIYEVRILSDLIQSKIQMTLLYDKVYNFSMFVIKTLLETVS